MGKQKKRPDTELYINTLKEIISKIENENYFPVALNIESNSNASAAVGELSFIQKNITLEIEYFEYTSDPENIINSSQD